MHPPKIGSFYWVVFPVLGHIVISLLADFHSVKKNPKGQKALYNLMLLDSANGTFIGDFMVQWGWSMFCSFFFFFPIRQTCKLGWVG